MRVVILTTLAGICHSLQLGSWILQSSVGKFSAPTISGSSKSIGGLDNEDITQSKYYDSGIVGTPESRLEGKSDGISRRNIIAAAAVVTGTVAAPRPGKALSKNKKSATTTTSTTTWQESVSGSFAGASLVFLKTLVKYPLDTASVRLQMPNSNFSIRKPLELFDDAFAGIWNPLLWNIPGGAVFFAVKDGTKSFLKATGMPKWAATCIAVFVANFPYWVIRNPSEVVKTKQQAKDYEDDINAWEAFRTELKENGLSGFYVGYWENIIYAYPADILKFLIYDQLTSAFTTITPLEGAIAGALATATAQFLTTPLDVVRNRVMTANTGSYNNKNMIEMLISINESEGRQGLLAGASPRVTKAFLSGAIQFATYEETKQQVLDFLQRQAMTLR